MGTQAPRTLLQLAMQGLLTKEAVAISALEDLPVELFPPLFTEALASRSAEALRAMVQAWPFPFLPLGALMKTPHLDTLQAVLDGLDGLLSLQVLPSQRNQSKTHTMFSTAVRPESLSAPGWRVEKKYSTRVLTGNWVEERRKFTRATEQTPQSNHRKEYVPFPGHKPDQISRWYGKRRVEGLPYKHLITHHQEPSHRYLISTYDDHYNRHNYNPGLPALRTWNGQKLLWLPEKSDFPLLAPPTNYGLYERLQQRWLAPKAGPRDSIYTSSYPRLPLCAMSRREHAIPVPPPRLHPVPHF